MADTEGATGHVPKDNTGFSPPGQLPELQRAVSVFTVLQEYKSHQQFPTAVSLPEQHETTVGLGGLVQHWAGQGSAGGRAQ